MNDDRSDLSQARRLLERMPCPAMAIDREEVIRAGNDAMGELAGCPADQLAGRRLTEMVLGEGMRPGDSDEDRPHRGDLHVMRRGDGALRLVIEHRDEPGSFDAADALSVVTLTDVTELKRSEEGWHELCTHISRLSDTAIEEALRLRHRLQMAGDAKAAYAPSVHEAYFDTIHMLALASEARDEQTGAHLRRIAAYTRAVAVALGIDDAEADAMSAAAILHDVGKLHVPETLLLKTGPLSTAEQQLIRRHTVAGERMLPDKPTFALARRIARSHHENWDGSGYPDGLRGEAIPIAARIVRVADVFDALVSARPYKHPWPAEQAVAYLLDHAGTLFQPTVVDAFVQCVHRDAADPIAYCCMLSSAPSNRATSPAGSPRPNRSLAAAEQGDRPVDR